MPPIDGGLCGIIRGSTGGKAGPPTTGGKAFLGITSPINGLRTELNKPPNGPLISLAGGGACGLPIGAIILLKNPIILFLFRYTAQTFSLVCPCF